ncbi:MAG: hypothetical protein H8D45_02870 [Bacteroidetes bacterium]|nr:hypothetical protein [Bacteroidota bacterium]
MKIIGFKLQKNEMFFVIAEKNSKEIKIIDKEKISFPTNLDIPAFTNWIETQFKLIIDKSKPDKIIYKLTTELRKHDQIFHIYFSLGILNLISFKKTIQIKHVAPQSLRPKAFGLANDQSIDDYICKLFKNELTPWNKNIREIVSCVILNFKK